MGSIVRWEGADSAGCQSCRPPERSAAAPDEHVIGSNKVHETGPLAITGVTQLTLVVDPARTRSSSQRRRSVRNP